MWLFPQFRVLAICALALSVAPATSADESSRSSQLKPGDYQVSSIQAWDVFPEALGNAPLWERVEVREKGEKWEMVVHWKGGGSTRTYALRPRVQTTPTTHWDAGDFAVSASELPKGGYRLNLHFCYRGNVFLTPQPKSSSPKVTP